jgi:hypothetical protein
VQIELRGGRAHGRRLTVPEGTSEVTVPIPNSRGFDSGEIYRPSGEHRDGAEIWLAVESPWTETGPVPL